MDHPTPRASVGLYVEDEDGRVLLIRRGPDAVNGADQIALPGGKLDAGETIDQAGSRELVEETGVVAEDVVRLTTVTEDREWGPAQHFVTSYRAIGRWSGEARIMEPHKHSEILWLHPEEITRMVRDGSKEVFAPLRDFVLAGGLVEARHALHGRWSPLPMFACLVASFSLLMNGVTIMGLGHPGAAWMLVGGAAMLVCALVNAPKRRPALT